MPAHETMVYRDGHGMVTKSRAHEIDRELAKSRASDKRSDAFDYKRVERGSWVFRDGKLVPKGEAMLDDVVKKNTKRSHLSAPMVMGDLKPYRNMVDGKEVDGRVAHREFLKRNNLIEVGNEKMEPKNTNPAKGEIAREIKETIEQLRAGYVDPSITEAPQDGFEVDSAVDLGDVKDGEYIRSDVTPVE